MSRLAGELEVAGYIRVEGDPKDARARVLQLARTGRRSILDSLEVMADLEHRYDRAVGRDRFAAMLGGLAIFIEGAEQDEAL
jgi:DNA-binding MarR family transcriptional regulator